MKQAYITKRFNAATAAVIDQANQIIDEYRDQGFILTLRQLYYQFVARDLIPNRQKEYKRLGNIVSDGRLAGMIDWSSIEDRTRNLQGNSHWDSPGDILAACVSSFRYDKWENQPTRIECWIEKDALVGVIAQSCKKLDIDFFSCRGYVSQSELHSAAMRLRSYEETGQNVLVLHLGDHDPSGIDMSRDIEDRFRMFGAVNTELRRIALNMDQIEEYSPPPNPAKATDARFANYTEEYGAECWELDALEPRVLRDLIEENVLAERDEDLYSEVCGREAKAKARLKELSDQLRDEDL